MGTKHFSLLEVTREAIALHESRYSKLGDFTRQVLREEIETRATPIAKALGITFHEVSILLALASESTVCDLLARRCADFWQDDLRDVIILEARLMESLRLGSLKKYINYEEARRMSLRPETKAEVYHALTEA